MSKMKLRKLSKLKPGHKFIFISGDGYTKTKLGNVPSLDGKTTFSLYQKQHKHGKSIHVSTNEPEIIWFKGE